MQIAISYDFLNNRKYNQRVVTHTFNVRALCLCFLHPDGESCCYLGRVPPALRTHPLHGQLLTDGAVHGGKVLPYGPPRLPPTLHGSGRGTMHLRNITVPAEK